MDSAGRPLNSVARDFQNFTQVARDPVGIVAGLQKR
jgi:hypothetical protein